MSDHDDQTHDDALEALEHKLTGISEGRIPAPPSVAAPVDDLDEPVDDDPEGRVMVEPHAQSGWVVRFEDGEAVATTPTKSEAMKAARAAAIEHGRSIVKHRQDGSVQDEITPQAARA